MADQNPNFNAAHSVDPRSGFCPQTKIFHSLRPPLSLPPISQPFSITEHAFSLLQSSPPPADATVLVDLNSGVHLSYATFLRQIRILASNLKALTSLSNGQVAFILAPTSLQLPVLYFALLSLGIVISPANPTGSESEISHQVKISKPIIAFATSSTASKLPGELGKILIDSTEFLSMMSTECNRSDGGVDDDVVNLKINQSDTAAILYSSGTTGRVKGVLLTHRNFIAANSSVHGFQLMVNSEETRRNPVFLSLLPLFHALGFVMLIRAISRGDTVVLMQRFDFEGMLRAVEKYKVTYIPVSPPIVVALAKSELKAKYDLSSLRILGCGGAPLGKEVIDKFYEKFPDVVILQGYGLTETTMGVWTMGREESKKRSSVGQLMEGVEAKIVDPSSLESLPPGHKGELWLGGPGIMKGYIGDEKATAETLHPEGWLKTGDLCYFDFDGFLYIVDRLKELIKYKAYQVPPAELEHLLQSNSEIIDAAVISYPDEEAGEIPMAYVVRKPGSNITKAQVIDFIAKQVAPYKKIRRVSFINVIPKSPSGKILRRELAKHAISHGSNKL